MVLDHRPFLFVGERRSEFIIAFDVGSSSVRAALFDHSGVVVPETLVKHERALETNVRGEAVLEAEAAVSQLIAAIGEVLERAVGIVGEITHAASCCFWHSLVGVGIDGVATTEVMTWADRRSREQTATLRSWFDEAEMHARTGARFHSSFWPAKLLWIRENDPDAWQRTTRWLSLSDLIGLRLFGSGATSMSMASATGMFDQTACVWDTELCKWLSVGQERLPPIAAKHETFTLLPEFAERWPRLAETAWYPSIGDGAASNIGSGCSGRGAAALMLGTSGAIRVVRRGAPPETLPAGLWCYRIDAERVVIGGALSDGGGLYEWLQNNLGFTVPESEIAAEIARRGPDSHGLTFLPFLAGERSTGYDEDAVGRIDGLRLSHDRIDILQAGMESVIYRLAAVLDQISAVASVDRITASGGAIDNSGVWARMTADILGRDISVLNDHEASLRGAVLLALESIGKIESIESFSPDTNRIEHRPDRRAIYVSARKRHDKLYDQTRKRT